LDAEIPAATAARAVFFLADADDVFGEGATMTATWGTARVGDAFFADPFFGSGNACAAHACAF
jgi:hypothetical protein